MTDRTTSTLLRGLGLTIVFVLLFARAGYAQTLSGSLVSSVKWPQREFVFSNPSNQALTSSSVSVTENGQAVSNLTVTPIRQAAPGQFGVELVIDQSTQMGGQSLSRAMDAARVLATERTGNQELGLITYDATANSILPLTSNANAINQVLRSSPWVGPGARVLPAISLALQQLANAHIADGAVIVIADGLGDDGAAAAPPSSIAAAAQAAGVRIYTVGLKDANGAGGSVAALANSIGATVIKSSGVQLDNVFTGIWSTLSHDYIVGYSSSAPLGHQVSVAAQVNGVQGSLTFNYATPAPPPPPPVKHRPPTRHHAPAQKPSIPIGLPTLSPTPPTHPSTFWTSQKSLAVIAFGCAALIGLGVALLLIRGGARRGVQTRVGNFLIDREASEELSEEELQAGGGPLGRFLRASSWWPAFVEQVGAARMRQSPVQLVRLTVGGSLVGALVATLLLGSIMFGILALILGPIVLWMVVRRTARKMRIKFGDQLPTHLQDLAGAMRAGRSFVGALSAVAEAADEPIRGELERALADERLGMPIDQAIHAISVRMQSDDTDQVALVASLNRSSGANVAESLDRVADGARERSDLRRELAALTGQARISAWVLTGLPVLMLIATSVIDPTYAHPMFHTIGGWVVVILSGIMVISGRLVMSKIVAVEV